jgi:hypothetical protein
MLCVLDRTLKESGKMDDHKEIQNPKRPEWSFYPSWIILTSLCLPVVFFLDLVILRIIIIFVGDIIYVDGVRHITEDYLALYIFIPLTGLFMGFLQYGLLRRYLPRMGWWVIATTGGWLTGILLILISSWLNWISALPKNTYALFGLLGLSIGMAQWLLLRLRLAQAGWWIAANVVGWGLIGLITPNGTLGQFGLFIVGFLPACTTAAMLALLMNKAPRPN